MNLDQYKNEDDIFDLDKIGNNEDDIRISPESFKFNDNIAKSLKEITDKPLSLRDIFPKNIDLLKHNNEYQTIRHNLSKIFQEPVKQFNQSITSLAQPDLPSMDIGLISNESPINVSFPTLPPIENQSYHQPFSLPHSNDEKINKVIRKLDEINKKIVQQKKSSVYSSYYFEEKTLVIHIDRGNPRTVNLSPSKTKGTNTFRLMSVLIGLLKLKGVPRYDYWLAMDVSMSEIIKSMKKEFNQSIDRNWIKNNKANLIKLLPDGYLGNIILFSNYHRKKNCYEFGIKRLNK